MNEKSLPSAPSSLPTEFTAAHARRLCDLAVAVHAEPIAVLVDLAPILAGAGPLSTPPKEVLFKRAMSSAIGNDRLDIVRFLLPFIPPPTRIEALHAAAFGGKYQIVEFLIEPAMQAMSAFKEPLWLAINAAALNGHLPVVERLLQMGDPPTEFQSKMLVSAIRGGHIDVIYHALRRYPSAAPGNMEAMQTAIYLNYWPIVIDLAALGADPSQLSPSIRADVSPLIMNQVQAAFDARALAASTEGKVLPKQGTTAPPKL